MKTSNDEERVNKYTTVSDNGNTFLYRTSPKNNKINYLPTIHETNTSSELLFEAVKLNDIQKVKAHINIDNVNMLDESGKTPLDYAFSDDKPEMYDLLVLHGAKTSRELLFEAVKLNDIQKVKSYIKFKDVKLNLLGKHGKTLLDFAFSDDNQEMVKLLESHGAKTSLEISSESNEMSLLQSLIKVSSSFQPTSSRSSSTRSERSAFRIISPKGPSI